MRQHPTQHALAVTRTAQFDRDPIKRERAAQEWSRLFMDAVKSYGVSDPASVDWDQAFNLLKSEGLQPQEAAQRMYATSLNPLHNPEDPAKKPALSPPAVAALAVGGVAILGFGAYLLLSKSSTPAAGPSGPTGGSAGATWTPPSPTGPTGPTGPSQGATGPTAANPPPPPPPPPHGRPTGPPATQPPGQPPPGRPPAQQPM